MNVPVKCGHCGQVSSVESSTTARAVLCSKCHSPLFFPAPLSNAEGSGPAEPPECAVVAAYDGAGNSNPYVAPAVEAPELTRAETYEPERLRLPRRKGSYVGILTALSVVIGGILAIAAWQALRPVPTFEDDRNFLSDNPIIVATEDMNRVLSSDAGQTIKGREASLFAAISRAIEVNSNGKLKMEDIGRMTFSLAGRRSKLAGVVRFNRRVSEEDIPLLIRGTKSTVGQHQMSAESGNAICQIDSRTIAVGDEASLRKVLERDGPAILSDELKAALREIDFSKPFAVAASLGNRAEIGDAAGIAPANMGSLPRWLDDLRSGGFQIDFGSDIQFTGVVICKDATAAEQMKKMTDGGLALAKTERDVMSTEAAKAFNSIEVSAIGSTVHASLRGDVASIFSLVEHFVSPRDP